MSFVLMRITTTLGFNRSRRDENEGAFAVVLAADAAIDIRFARKESTIVRTVPESVMESAHKHHLLPCPMLESAADSRW